MGNFRLSRAILGYLWLSLAISGYLLLSLAISGYLWLSLTILGYFYQVSSIRVQVKAGGSKLLLFQTFPFFFLYFTDPSYRGACAPKNRNVPISIWEFLPNFPVFRSASSSRTRSGEEKKINQKVSNSNSMLSPAPTCTLILDTW